MKIDYYFDKIAEYYEEHDTVDFTKKIMFCINDCLNLLDTQFIDLPEEEIKEYRRKGILALEANSSDILKQLGVEIFQKVKPYNTMSYKEQMAIRALLSFFYFPTDDWGKYQTLDFSLDFLINSGVDEEAITPILFNHFPDIIGSVPK
jgi:hypothetical protein